ncbi:hypothetical protein [Paraburkholderia youngii]|uniref:hypothetical protein n=1 Tax=Paraburkholderia youngii TaxID=2782701 RepID=UPI003D1D2717
MRLDDLQDEAGGSGGVERIAAFFEDRHRRCAREPVRRGHHAEGADQFWTGCKRHARLLGDDGSERSNQYLMVGLEKMKA